MIINPPRIGQTVTVRTSEGPDCTGIVQDIDDAWLRLAIPGALFGAKIPLAHIDKITTE